MSFSFSPWLLLPVLIAGLWLAHALYLRASAVAPRRWRRPLALLTLAAWLILAGLLAQPLWNGLKSIYRVPVIVVAVDGSPSYAAGGGVRSGDAVRREVEAAKTFYREKGFRVLELSFGETVRPAASHDGLGELTSLNALHRYLDSLATPNLQGVFLWTDGRFNLDTEGGEGWSAPVFPVVPPVGAWNEVQGESVAAELSDSGAEVSVAWRQLGKGGASLELQSDGRSFWKEKLPAPDSASGKKLLRRFHLPAGAFHGATAWTALIRPESMAENTTTKNDTLDVRLSGFHRRRQVFLRPLQSLDERAMMDALFASDSLEAAAVEPESLRTRLRYGDVLWARSHEAPRALAAARARGVPVILYESSGEAASRRSPFDSLAHVAWREDGNRLLPAAVLSLADLGGSGLELREPDSTLEPLVWAEESNRRGILLGRRKNGDEPVFELSLPSFWSSRFRPDADERVRRLQEGWLQGIAEWVRLQGEGAQVIAPPVLLADRPFFLTARVFANSVAARDSTTRWDAREDADGKENSLTGVVESKESETRLGPFRLAAGKHALSVYSDGARIWSDTLRVRYPADVEASRIGIDVEALSALALETHGKLLRASNGDFTTSLPDLPRGQIQETLSKSTPVFPSALFTFLVIALLSAVWALRKKLRLD